MSEQGDLVTKIDVIPDLAGIDSFDAAIERAIGKVNQLDAAIKRVNNLKPASPYAPRNTAAAPSVATTAAVATIAATGANLITRTPLAETVRKEAQKVARAAVEGTASGLTGLPSPALRLPPTQQPAAVLPALKPPVIQRIQPLPQQTVAPVPVAPVPRITPPAPQPAAAKAPSPSSGGGGLSIPPQKNQNWSNGHAGGLATRADADFAGTRKGFSIFGESTPRKINDIDLGGTDWNEASGKSKPKKKPVADGVEKATRNPFGVDSMLAGAGLTAGIVAAGNALASSLDSIQRQQAQIARLAQTTGDAKDAFFALNQAASDVRSDSGAFISTYTNMATATQKLGLSQEQTIQATQGLVGALQLGGGSAESVNAALYQMGQAFSSDRFSGDEFKSFMEAIGTMAPEVAKAFGTDVKGLRDMSTEGKLTAETMIKAFQKLAASNADLLKKQGWTWGQVTTVMKNDWQAFLAKATISGEWQKFTDWAANTLIPVARKAEGEVAEFWSTLADESKSAILIGILGAVGAAFFALATPVLAAVWPFLAVGAAVWLVYEAFVEWKAWLSGEGGTVFDSLFGSFDEFEKRYPNLVSLLRGILDLAAKATKAVQNLPGNAPVDSNASGIEKTQDKLSWVPGLLLPPGAKQLGGLGAKIWSYFSEPSDIESSGSAIAGGKGGSQSSISNSGNVTTNITVATPQQAAETANNLTKLGTVNSDIGGNIAESTGAR